MIGLSFGLFLLLFVAIGLLSVRQRQKTSADYLLASQNVKPWLVGLSAVATNNSGYMFLGMIGFTYEFGLSAVWLMVGFAGGDFLSSLLVHRKLRARTDAGKQPSFAGTLSSWHGTDFQWVRALGGGITVLFLGVYAAAQFSASGKALFVLFDLDIAVGACIGAAIVLTYCVAGGIRASIWTDAAQTFVMLGSMAAMLWVAVREAGGLGTFVAALQEISPEYMALFPSALAPSVPGGPALLVVGWLAAGVGVIGQPHIMVRYMAMDDPKHMARVRAYYYSWYAVFWIVTIGVGLASRLLLAASGSFDPELGLPLMAMEYLPPVFVGLILAGIFAATISTADSQILSCTAAVTRDFPVRGIRSYGATKLATLCATVLALAMALGSDENVFTLTLIAWSTLACAFGPLLIVYSLDQETSQRLALAMMVSGMVSALAWREFGLHATFVHEVVPGMLAGFLVFGVGKLFGAAVALSSDAGRSS